MVPSGDPEPAAAEEDDPLAGLEGQVSAERRGARREGDRGPSARHRDDVRAARLDHRAGHIEATLGLVLGGGGADLAVSTRRDAEEALRLAADDGPDGDVELAGDVLADGHPRE